MSNKEEIDLKEVSVELHQVREVLKCILHTIIFNRALGLVRPRDTHLQLLDMTYVEIGDDAIDKQVDAALAAAHTFLERNAVRPASARKAVDEGFPFVVRLSFYEATTRQGLLSTYEDRVFWETWTINMRLISAPPDDGDVAERDARRGALQERVNDIMTMIVHSINSLKDHIPPVQEKKKGAPSPLTYPFEITTMRAAGLRESIIGTVSRLFSASSGQHPPSVMH